MILVTEKNLHETTIQVDPIARKCSHDRIY